MKIAHKLIISLILFFLGFFCFAETRIGFVQGSSALVLSGLVGNPDYILNKYESPEELSQALKNCSIDVCLLPVLTAAELYNQSKNNVLMMASCQNASFYIVSNVNTVHSFSDLLDKTVYVSGHSYLINYFLEILKNDDIPVNLAGGSVLINESLNQHNIISRLINEKLNFSVLSEEGTGAALLASRNIKVVLSLQDEYSSIHGSKAFLPYTAVCVRRQFSENHGEELLSLQLDLEDSIRNLDQNPGKAKKNAGFFGVNSGIIRTVISLSDFKYNRADLIIEEIKKVLEINNISDFDAEGFIFRFDIN